MELDKSRKIVKIISMKRVKVLIISLVLASGVMGFDFDNNGKIEIFSNDELLKSNITFKTEVILDDEFDPTLPTEPPPDEVDIVGSDDFEEESFEEESFVKGVRLDDFDIDHPSKIKYLDLVIKNAKEQGFDVELTLAIIKKESSFDPKKVSKRGAIGLMQLLPSTARWLGLKDISKLEDPDTNIKYGIKYLRYLFSKVAPDMDYSELKVEDASKQGFLKVLAAYNAGPRKVKKYDRPPYNGIPPFRETRDYVKKVPFYFIKFEELGIEK